MKIHELPGISVEQLQASKTGGVTPQEDKAAPDQATTGVDVIQLSPQARLMQKAAHVVAETPEVRPEKVLALKDSWSRAAMRWIPSRWPTNSSWRCSPKSPNPSIMHGCNRRKGVPPFAFSF